MNRDYKIWTIGIAKEIPRTDLTNGKNKIKQHEANHSELKNNVNMIMRII